jgi:hypothetical protein
MRKSLVVAVAIVAMAAATQSSFAETWSFAKRNDCGGWTGRTCGQPRPNQMPAEHTCYNIAGKPYKSARPCGIS